MAEKIRDYTKLAQDIIELTGGEENISSVTHCATRLRLVLVNTPKEANKKISALPGVVSVVEKGGQFQVVIGTHVTDVYAAVSENLRNRNLRSAELYVVDPIYISAGTDRGGRFEVFPLQYIHCAALLLRSGQSVLG